MTVARDDDWPRFRHRASVSHPGGLGSSRRPVRCRRVPVLTSELPFLDHTTDAFAADPHGELRTMRTESWIVRTPTGLGVLSYQGCNALLLDPAFRPGVFEMMRRTGPDGTAVEGPRTLLAAAGTVHLVEQIADQAGGAGAEHFDPSGREPGHDDAPQVLVVAALRSEQSARTLDGGSVGTGARIISKTPGRNAGSSNNALQPWYESTPRPVGVRTIHDSGRRAQLAVRIGRERVGGVVEERQLTRQYRHAAAAYRSP